VRLVLSTDPLDVSPRLLRCFVAVVDERSLLPGAREVLASLSALSGALAAAQQTLRVAHVPCSDTAALILDERLQCRLVRFDPLLVAELSGHAIPGCSLQRVPVVRLDGFLSITDEDFQASLQLNFFAALRATRAAVADMIKRGNGTIINVASVNAVFEPDGAVIDYGAAKAALVSVSKALSQELGPHGIRITSVSPGPVATDLWDELSPQELQRGSTPDA
jgi:NAD(P)-dependent dehydrogenase (short-subunit alcohol dehydrogenase family)